MIKALAVFCGSKSGKNSLFEIQASQLGRWMATNNITLIYGGGGKGLMGAVANGCLENNGKIIGIIPKLLMEWETYHKGVNEMIITETMHERKKLLYEKCDAAVVLPGGFGSLDELFEMLTWNQLSIHDKKIYLLNTDGFYNHLLAHVYEMQQQDFLYDKIEDRIIAVDTIDELIEKLQKN